MPETDIGLHAIHRFPIWALSPGVWVIAQVSHTDVVLTGLAGDTSAEPSLSACLFPG
jgi:hypothetical protein